MGSSARRAAVLFVGLFAVYNSNMRPVASGDSFGAALLPFSVVLDGSITLDRFAPWLREHKELAGYSTTERGGHVYSSYPIGGALLVSPLYLPARVMGFDRMDPSSVVLLARVAEKLVASGVASVSAVLLFLLLRSVTNEAWACALAWVFGLCTSAFSISAQAMWQQTTDQLAIIAALLLSARWLEHRAWGWAAGCGLVVGVAVWIRPTNELLCVALIVALYRARASLRDYAAVAAPVAVATATLVAYNLRISGDPQGFYLASVLDGNIFNGLAGIQFSPARGLLIYTPVLVLALRRPRGEHAVLWTACAAFSLLHVLLIAKWRYWWGGYSWGPRLLSEAVPPLFVMLAMRPVPKRLFWALASWGLMMQAVGVYFYPKGHWDNEPASVDKASYRAWDWSDNPVARSLRGGFVWEGYAAASALIQGGPSAAAAELQRSGLNPY